MRIHVNTKQPDEKDPWQGTFGPCEGNVRDGGSSVVSSLLGNCSQGLRPERETGMGIHVHFSPTRLRYT